MPSKILKHRRGLALLGCAALGLSAFASSHREAPSITKTPKLDATDFYAFNSYEPGREDYVTLIAAYLPLQDAYGGPNYFSMDPDALYEIHIDNTGDSIEDLTFQFRFTNSSPNVALTIGPVGNRKTNAVPVLAVGPISAGDNSALNYQQTYTLNIVRGPRRAGTSQPIVNSANGSATFTKPMDNVGTKTIPNYNTYANQYIYTVNIPGSDKTGRLFVGQRKDPFVVNLGETFDLINISTSPLGSPTANKDSLAYKNVTCLILELPKSLVTSAPNKPTIAAWTTASAVGANGAATQMSRLGNPLVNEVVIGFKDKDKFNASEPKDDPQFLDYVTHPTLPAIIELLYGSAGVKAPTAIPRTDLVAVFLTGVDGLNKDGSVGEMLRLNTSIAAKAPAQQMNLGVLANDLAGFPNGRRPGDDVVDIALRAAMGFLLSTNDAPSGKLPFTDGATVVAQMFPGTFPYINPPLPGSPNDPYVTLTLQTSAAAAGPYKGVPATFNPNTHQLETPKPTNGAAYYRSLSDSYLSLGQPAVNENTVRVPVKTP